MEKAFEAMECTNKERVAYTVYMLQSSASEWLDAHKRSYPEGTKTSWNYTRKHFTRNILLKYLSA
jgi:hypothetical protein